jgi:hypothetical protein
MWVDQSREVEEMARRLTPIPLYQDFTFKKITNKLRESLAEQKMHFF